MGRRCCCRIRFAPDSTSTVQDLFHHTTETQQKHNINTKYHINTTSTQKAKTSATHNNQHYNTFSPAPRHPRTIEPTSNLSVVQAQLLKHFVLDFFLPGHCQKQIDPGQTHPIQKVFPIRPRIPHQTAGTGFLDTSKTEVKHQMRGSVRASSNSDPSGYCVGCWCTNAPHVSKQ